MKSSYRLYVESAHFIAPDLVYMHDRTIRQVIITLGRVSKPVSVKASID